MSARSARTRGPPLSHLRLSTRNGGGQPATSQVKKLVPLFYFVLLLVMMSCAGVGLANPRIEDGKGGISHFFYKRNYCNPIPEHELIRRMGSSFDPNRMATSEDGVKRSATPLPDDEETDYGEDEEDMGDEMEEELEEEGASDVDDESAFVDSAMGGGRGGGAGDGGYGSNRDMADNGMANQDGASSSRDSFTSTTERPVFRYPMMRRRRGVPSDHVQSGRRDLREVDDSLLPLQLLSNSKKKKLRKQLKQKLREKLNSRKFRKNPPWECKMRPIFERTKANYFPEYVQSGQCETDKCFYRLYRCVPKKYAVKLMKLDPDRCVPVPTLSQETTYEEHWDMVSHYVTVGCDCKPKRRRQKK